MTSQRLFSGLFVVFFIGGLSNAHAQLDRFLLKPFMQEKSVTYGLNNRRTHVFDENTTIYGAYAGVQFGSNLKHVATINSSIFWMGNSDDFAVPSEVQLNFVGFSEEYVFWRKKRWNLSTYVHLGVGKARFRPINQQSITPFISSDWVLPFEGGIQGEYSINKWLSVRGGTGYRYVFNRNNWALHGAYVKIGAGVKIKELIVSINHIRQLPQRLLPSSR